MNLKGKSGITKGWASIVLTILRRKQVSSAIFLHWLNKKYTSFKHKDLVINENESPKEDEIVKYKVSKLKILNDQKVSLTNEGINHSAPELKEPVVKHREEMDVIEPVRFSINVK
jgi:hypothetical protein